MPTLTGVRDVPCPHTLFIKVATYEHPLQGTRGRGTSSVDERNMHVGNCIPTCQHAHELHTLKHWR